MSTSDAASDAPQLAGPDARARRPTALGRWVRSRPQVAWYLFSLPLAIVLYAVGAPVAAAAYGIAPIVALALPLVRSAALVLVLRLPWVAIVAFAIAGSAESLSMAEGSDPWPWNVTTIIGYVALTGLTWALHGWSRGLAALLLPGVAITLPIIGDFSMSSLPSAIVALSLGVVASAAGWLVSDRFRITGQLDRERAVSHAEQERRLVAEERQRIARELHDVVAHGLSLIQVQATSAPYRVPDVTPDATAEFEDIARQARSSLAEMRRLLGTLRGDDAVEHAPQPTTDDLPRLVDDARSAGAEIALVMPDRVDAPVAVAIAAFRIVQESISNAMRHAPGAAIDVALDVIDEALVIEVRNAAATTPAHASGPGHGLVGMRERATLLGGSLNAGRTPAGGYRVAASLPIPATGGQAHGA